MGELTALLGIAAAISIGAASPGPSFVVVARQAVSAGRVTALWSAAGMGVGGLFFACIALVGLNSLLLAVPSLYAMLKVVGGIYLVYLGYRIWRGASKSLAEEAHALHSTPRSSSRSFAFALTTQISNPKAAIIYGSVFSAFLPPAPSTTFNVSVAIVVLLIETGWYALVAVVLSSEHPRQVYLRYKIWIDRTAAGVMGALGLKLVVAGAASTQP